MTLHTRIVGSTVLAAAMALAAPAGISAQDPLESYSALAVDMSASNSRSTTANVQIGISRWSSDSERDVLVNTLLELGPAKLLDKLSGMPKAGFIRTPDSIGYDIHYARKTSTGDDQRIVLVTDRPIGFWEASRMTRSTDYPFTVIELHVKPNGTGEGKLSIATKITADKESHSVVLEDYGNGPVLLTAVTRDKK